VTKKRRPTRSKPDAVKPGVHHLVANSLEVSPLNPLPKPTDTHRLSAQGIGVPDKRGRPKAFESLPVAELITELENWLASLPKIPKQLVAVDFFRGCMTKRGLQVDISDLTIRRKIVMPIYRKLKQSKTT